MLRGYIIRWATYSNGLWRVVPSTYYFSLMRLGGFKEGVSLTVDDELNRWQKYGLCLSQSLFHTLTCFS